MRIAPAAVEAARGRRASVLALLTLMVGGCEADAGPGEVKLGRDACENCGMIISDPRFVAEVRLADGKLHKFDDPGGAVNWLSRACVAPADAKEFWVIDSADGKSWLDARKAYYRAEATPMDYGFAAVAAAAPDAIPFAAMREKVLKPQNACKKGGA